MGAMEHTLTQKLLAKFSDAKGVMIAFESLDLDTNYLYKYATYKKRIGFWQTHCFI